MNIAENEATPATGSDVAQASAVKVDSGRVSSMFPSLKRGDSTSEPGRVLFDAFNEISLLPAKEPSKTEPDAAATATAAPQQPPAAEKAATVATSLDRLKTALSLGLLNGDSSQTPTLPGEEQVRLRIENLLKRSRQFASEGEEAQARHLAQLAQKMVEESHLTFPPDAERPVDVLAFLDLQNKQPEPAKQPERPAENPPAGEPVATVSPTPKVEAPPVSPPPAEKAPLPAEAVASMKANTATPVTEPAPERAAPPADPAAATAGAAPSVELSPKSGRVEEPPALTGVAAVRQRFLASPAPRPAKPTEAGTAAPSASNLPARTISLPDAWPEMEGQLLDEDGIMDGWETVGIVAVGLLVCGALIAVIRRRRGMRLARV